MLQLSHQHQEYSYPDFGNSTVNKIYDKLTLKDFSGEVRKQQWRETFAMMREDKRWLTGVGFSGYQEAVKPFHQEGIFFNFDRDSDFRRKLVLFDDEYKARHWHPVEIYMYPHNLFLNFWVEMGLGGVILFVCPTGGGLRKILRKGGVCVRFCERFCVPHSRSY